jgi:hypothetical protein
LLLLMFFVPVHGLPPPSFVGSNLILPSVSMANSCQLGVEILLATRLARGGPASVRQIGHIRSPHVPAVAGADALALSAADQAGVPTTALEVWQTCDAPLVTFLQIRAAPLPGHCALFAHDLLEWASQAGFAEVVALAGTDAALRPRPADAEGVFWSGTPTLPGASRSRLAALQWPAFSSDPCDLSGVQNGGLARFIFRAAAERSVPLLLVLSYVSEGGCDDNAADGVRLAAAASDYLGWSRSSLVIPMAAAVCEDAACPADSTLY